MKFPKPTRYVNESYRKFVASFPCFGCQIEGWSQCAHANGGGMGTKRSDAQNRLLWARLGELSRQVNWHGQKLAAEEWKDVLTAALKKQRVVPGVDSGFVVLGQRTSQMSKQEMTELLDLIGAFGAQQGVEFTELEEA